LRSYCRMMQGEMWKRQVPEDKRNDKEVAVSHIRNWTIWVEFNRNSKATRFLSPHPGINNQFIHFHFLMLTLTVRFWGFWFYHCAPAGNRTSSSLGGALLSVAAEEVEVIYLSIYLSMRSNITTLWILCSGLILGAG